MLTNINKILVVDNETELAHAIEIHLSRSGFLMHSVHTLTAAQKMIRQAKVENALFDLVIADISLPGNSGIELLQWIQKRHPHISILLICGFGADDLIGENIRPLLDDFCKKPFDPQMLLSKIAALEEKRKSSHGSDSLLITGDIL